MNTLHLLIGGNQGDRNGILAQAADLVRQRIGSAVSSSHIYETEPWGDFADCGGARPQNFYNRALAVETALTPRDCLGHALDIEAELGRRRHCHPAGRYTSRPIDIDLILFGPMVLDTPDLVLPHPRMHLRRFVLAPLCEIAPDAVHPIFNKTLSQLLSECTDSSFCSLCC